MAKHFKLSQKAFKELCEEQPEIKEAYERGKLARNTVYQEPKVLTQEQIEEIERLAGFLTIAQLADYFGIKQATFSKILERQPEAGEKYKKGRSGIIRDLSSNLVTQARNGNTVAAMFYLKTQGGWREKGNFPDADSKPTPVAIQFVATDGRVEDTDDNPSV